MEWVYSLHGHRTHCIYIHIVRRGGEIVPLKNGRVYKCKYHTHDMHFIAYQEPACQWQCSMPTNESCRLRMSNGVVNTKIMVGKTKWTESMCILLGKVTLGRHWVPQCFRGFTKIGLIITVS
jgi:hypothetical protein